LHSLQNGGTSSVDENIKRQLAASESEVGDLRSEIQILQSTVSFLLYEKIGLALLSEGMFPMDCILQALLLS
jgi:hypothetical protein